MKASEIRELRELSQEELFQKEVEMKAELFNLRFRLATGNLDNPMSIKKLKRDMARVKTVIRQRELEQAE
ncbi:MAG: 50S ribosomal protein L29 [Bacillota bacterium]|jgi:large subunit ribosomal protein L29